MDKFKEFVASVTANWGRKEYIIAATVAAIIVIVILA